MPRKARLDVADTLHHVMARGIERGSIFKNDEDRERFLERLGRLSEEMSTPVYAFALIPNHFHLLLRSGQPGLSRFMRRLLTGYATSYNKRHRRAGHLFQNRYTSIICEEDAYFTELVRYIHLNPLRARVVKTLEELDSYRWGSHYYIVHKNSFSWYDADFVLKWFRSRKSYKAFMREGIEKKYLPNLSGGGLIRSLGGLTETVQQRGSPVVADERILGTSDFVKNLLSREQNYLSSYERTEKMAELIAEQCKKSGVAPDVLKGGIRAGAVSQLRARIALILVKELGIPYAEIGRQLGISTSRVSRIIGRKGAESR
jgi:REP element-mobilizing transposase RayT